MGEIRNLEKEKINVVLEKTRSLPSKLENVVKVAAILIGIYETVFIFNFNYTLYDLFLKLGVKISPLKVTFQTRQGEAFVMAMLLVITYLLHPARKREKELRKVPIYDYLLAILSLISMFYFFCSLQ